MRHLIVAASVAFAGITASWAQTPPKLCQDSLAKDNQPNFRDAGFERMGQLELLENPNALRLNTNQMKLDPENIRFPFEQEVSISYVYESAGASHTLGWLYYDDLVAKKYVTDAGTLVDGNNDGVMDLHADIYNVGNSTYVGKGPRRCSTKFTHGGKTYYEPELGMLACGPTFQTTTLRDARPGRTANDISVALIGQEIPDTPETVTADQFGDHGLYPHIPNLLEPKHPDNGNMGIGHLAFLLADDDVDTRYERGLGPVPDTLTDVADGIPDYNASGYTADGVPRNPPDDGKVNGADRTVSLGRISGGKQIVFFLISYREARHTPEIEANAHVYPCLKYAADGKCALHFRTHISVFFSKAAWNMDQNSQARPVTEIDIGCAYNRPTFSVPADTCSDTGRPLVGWLDQATLNRLSSEAAYGNLKMPHEPVTLDRPANGKMPHVVMGAPSTDPFRWILGFEDLSGGGDRDFNDVVFIINKINGGVAHSINLSSEILPKDAEDFTITNVRFARKDDATEVSWYEDRPGACSSGSAPQIKYSIAVDCRECSKDVCTPKSNPDWMEVEFPSTSPPSREALIDVVSKSRVGSQLCWKVDIQSPNEFCRPTIYNVDIGYQAIRAGNYTRAAVTPLANTIFYGAYQTPGKNMKPEASIRLYDGQKDFGYRGHFFLKKLFEPADRKLIEDKDPLGCEGSPCVWDSGKELAVKSLTERKIYTRDSAGALVTVESVMSQINNPVFNAERCNVLRDSKPLYDLNADETCDAASTAATTDLGFFRDWLYGWEDHATPGPANIRRAWPMGGVRLSTASVFGPPGYPNWWKAASATERSQFNSNFISKLDDRRTIAYVGTTQGFFQAFEAGQFKFGDDQCTSGYIEPSGYFEKQGTDCKVRSYEKKGTELFSYLPRALLSRYLNHYVPTSGETPASVDTSPTYAHVDFGIGNNKPDWTILDDSVTELARRRTEGAKTVIVSSTGREHGTVFAIDVTDPKSKHYPLSLWETDLGDPQIKDAFIGGPVPIPDPLGSRHAPLVTRVDFGPDKSKWVAAIATDYVPKSGAGAVYLLDLKTGLPVRLADKANAGVVVFEEGQGIGSHPAFVDTDGNGYADMLYAVTTSGKLFRVDLRKADSSRPLGTMLEPCMMADVQEVLKDELGLDSQDAKLQRVHANFAVQFEETNTTPVVKIYIATSDNPDDPLDGPAPSDRKRFKYHVLALNDPLKSNSCEADFIWAKPLDPGQTVWGGVVLDDKNVLFATASGTAADACNLDEDTSGKLYSLKKDDGGVVTNLDLGGHAVSSLVSFQGYAIAPSYGGAIITKGDGVDGPTGASTQSPRIRMWEVSPDGKLK